MPAGAALAFAVWVALRLIPGKSMNAATRYALWWSVFLIVAILPFLYLRTGETRSFAGLRVPAVSIQAEAPRERQNLQPGLPIPAAANTVRPPVHPTSAFHLPITIPAGPWPVRVLMVWLSASALMLFRLVASIVMLERRKAAASDVPATLAARVTQWVAHCGGSTRRIRLASSREVPVPLVAGHWHPTILLPSCLLDRLSEDDLEQIGIHEAAHLVRHDDHALLIQRLLQAVFALHPVMHWVSRRIDLEREIACDDFVIAATGNPQPYAAFLARVFELSGGVRTLPIAAAAAEDRSHLAKRVEMLLDQTRNAGTRVLGFRLALIAVCISALAWGAAQAGDVLAFAQPPATVGATITPISPGKVDPGLPQTLWIAQAQPLVAPPAFPILAQNSPAPPVAPMVFVPVEVTDPQGRFVTGLDKDVFKVQEDGVEQTTTELLAQDSRTEVFMLVDRGLGPDAHRLDLYQADFRGANAVLIPYDVEQGRLLDAVRRIGPGGTRKADDRRAMVILTTNQSTTPYTEAELTDAVRGLDMPVFSCELVDSTLPSGSPFLTELAAQTGGRHIAVSGPADLSDALSKALIELRNMYSVGYVPSNPARDGAYRRLEVTLQQPRGLPTLTARGRLGYFAPTH
jgi:beta-lactamase regulating signal transducer with metallopeptidase domain